MTRDAPQAASPSRLRRQDSERFFIEDVAVAPHWGVEQSDARTLGEIGGREFGDEPLDPVVDDASHLLEPTRTTFNALFPRLQHEGEELDPSGFDVRTFCGERGRELMTGLDGRGFEHPRRAPWRRGW